MGSALVGSLRILCFLTEGLFWGTPVNLLVIFPKVPGRTFLLNRPKFITFAAAPLALTPFRPHPKASPAPLFSRGPRASGLEVPENPEAVGAALGNLASPDVFFV